jgi:hypothetical protein
MNTTKATWRVKDIGGEENRARMISLHFDAIDGARI